MTTDAPAEAMKLALQRLRAGGVEIPEEETDPLISMREVSLVAQVRHTTPDVWRQRSQPGYSGSGRIEPQWPDPDDRRYTTRPQYRLSTIVNWLLASGRRFSATTT